ncbi:MAG: hypothetical protein DI563_01950 [Variovorax paradoxus]|uniref:Uncharacterized protein n=1 Tax=Variovorax paradoxus TaxID=34073 RepID=A0A2W5QSQ9_VARPD|nr:MAG: hypothetical protein DI563_01950 [Variovorax paradoxus]
MAHVAADELLFVHLNGGIGTVVALDGDFERATACLIGVIRLGVRPIRVVFLAFIRAGVRVVRVRVVLIGPVRSLRVILFIVGPISVCVGVVDQELRNVIKIRRGEIRLSAHLMFSHK